MSQVSQKQLLVLLILAGVFAFLFFILKSTTPKTVSVKQPVFSNQDSKSISNSIQLTMSPSNTTGASLKKADLFSDISASKGSMNNVTGSQLNNSVLSPVTLEYIDASTMRSSLLEKGFSASIIDEAMKKLESGASEALIVNDKTGLKARLKKLR